MEIKQERKFIIELSEKELRVLYGAIDEVMQAQGILDEDEMLVCDQFCDECIQWELDE